jgi:hypothetical protein
MRRCRADPAILALAAIVVLYNLPQLLTGTLQFDGVDVHYASQRYLSDELHAGRLPFWTPFIFSGFPFLADLQVAAWYPPNWPFFALGITPKSIQLELALHGFIACCGAYLLARRLIGPALPPDWPGAVVARTRIPAVVAAMLYGLSGWFATHSQHVGMVDTAAWLPWFLLLLDTLRQRLSPRLLALAALIGAAIALPGHFQLALYTFTFVALWAVAQLLPERSWAATRGLAIGIGAAAVGGALLSAVMLLPTIELVAQSERRQLNALSLPDIGYFHVGSLLTLVDPDYYGLLSGHYFGPGDSTQHYFYAGILALPLALIGLRHKRVAVTAASLTLPFLWYALGPSGGLYRLVARLPGFNSVELPMHGWFLVALGLALLGGAGMATLHRRIGQRWSVALIVFLFVDLLLFNQLLNPLAYARASFDALYGQPLAAFQAQVSAADPPVQRVYGEELSAVGYRNHALQSRVETTYGYNPLELSAYAEYSSAAAGNSQLIGGLAPTHRLLPNERLEPQPGTLPLAYFAASVLTVADQAAAQAALQDLDPAQTTIVEVSGLPKLQSDPSATVTVRTRGLDFLELHYVSRTANLMRVAIPLYPGWQAELGLRGTPLQTLRVDQAFIGVVVPPGEGDVRLSYSPRLFWPGAAISALALLGVTALLVARPLRTHLPPAFGSSGGTHPASDQKLA